jgi:putative transposase
LPRQPRYNLCGVPQHVITRGNDRQAIFYGPDDYAYYLKQLGMVAHRYGCLVHCYVLMTNHVHLLVTPQQENGVPKTMQALGGRYVRYINKRFGRTGTLFEGRYKASLVNSDEYLLSCYRYIEMNPVRAGIVEQPKDYRESSYRYHAFGQRDPVITQHDLYRRLGNDQEQRCERYRRLFLIPQTTTELDMIRNVTNSCLPLGNDCFKDQIEIILARTVRHKKYGRPKTLKN